MGLQIARNHFTFSPVIPVLEIYPKGDNLSYTKRKVAGRGVGEVVFRVFGNPDLSRLILVLPLEIMEKLVASCFLLLFRQLLV